MARWPWIAMLVVGLAGHGTAHAQPSVSDPEVAKGIRQAQDGDYDGAIVTLDAAAKRLTAAGGPATALGQAHLYLGIAYLAKGHVTTARARFRDALSRSRELVLSPDEFPPKVIEAFEEARAELKRDSTQATGRAAGEGIAIEHAEVGCIQAEHFVKIEARFDPAPEVARARVHFRATGTPSWYYVEMKPAEGVYAGVLPRPKKGTPGIDYYLEVTSRSFVNSRTREYTPQVVQGAACEKKMAATVAGVSSLLVSGPAGAPVVPVGFSSASVAAAGTTTTAAGTGTATSSGGGGIGAKGLLIGGAAAAAGGVAVLASRGGDSESGRTVLLRDTIANVASRVGNVFRTFQVPGAGTLDATADWSDGSKDIDIYISDSSCTSFHECRFLAQSNTRGKPERIGAFQVTTTGTFNLFVVNESDNAESAVTIEVGLTRP